MPTDENEAEIEIEIKYSLSDRSVLDRLLAVETLAGFAAGERIVERVTDLYLDTASRAILAAGYACRVRQRHSERHLTLKSLGQASAPVWRRHEHEILLDPTGDPLDVGRWAAGSPRELVEQAIKNEPLQVLFTVRQTRHICPLLDGDRPLVELSLDEVYYGTKPIFELEVELLPSGSEAELRQIARTLQADWQLCSVPLSKFERGLRMLERGDIPASPPTPRMETQAAAIRPSDPMSTAGRITLRLHFARMLAHEAGARRGEDIEELHDMRVATRRMRAAFRIFGPYFPPKAIRPHLKGLKQTGRALGAVRDLDVFQEKATMYLDTLPADQASALDGLLANWRQERNAARERMIAYLDSQAYSDFVECFARFLSAQDTGAAVPVLVGKPIPFQVRHIAPRLIYGRFGAVRAYEPWIESAAIELLHSLRIDFKRLRYALEFFAPVLGRESALVIREIKRMQDHLGDLNDADVATRLLGDFMENGEGQSGLIAYLRNRELEKTRLLDTFRLAWERFNRPLVRRNLALALAAL